MEQGTQYLVKLADGLDYARVEPWQGGLSAAKREAESIGGYVVALDDDLCSTGEIVVDYRAPKPALDTEKVTYARLEEPARLHRGLENCLAVVDDYLGALYPDNGEEPSAIRRMYALGALEELEQLARELRANIEGR